MNMKVRIKWNDKEFELNFEHPEKSIHSTDVDKVINYLETLDEVKQFFDTDDLVITYDSFYINDGWSCNHFISNSCTAKTCDRKGRTRYSVTKLGQIENKDENISQCCAYSSSTLDADKLIGTFDMDLIDEGLVLCDGGQLTGNYMFAVKSKSYLSRTTSKKYTSSIRNQAKTFKNEKALLQFLVKNESMLNYVASNYERCYTVEYKSEYYGSYIDHAKPNSKVEEMLRMINGSRYIGHVEDARNENNFSDEQINMILYMRSLNLSENIISRRVHLDEVIMSDNLKICELDTNAQHAVEVAKKYDFIPLHVTKGNFLLDETEKATFYDVIGFQKGENNSNVDKNCLDIFCYNPTMDIEEFGSIMVETLAGSIRRITK